MRHVKLLVLCMWYTIDTREDIPFIYLFIYLFIEHLSVCWVISEDDDTVMNKTNTVPYLNETSRQEIIIMG